MSVDPAKVAQLINDIADGVERSRFGPILAKSESNNYILNTLPHSIFLTILSGMIIKMTPEDFNFKKLDDKK